MQQPARPAPPQKATQEGKEALTQSRNISAQPSARLAAALDKTNRLFAGLPHPEPRRAAQGCLEDVENGSELGGGPRVRGK